MKSINSIHEYMKLAYFHLNILWSWVLLQISNSKTEKYPQSRKNSRMDDFRHYVMEFLKYPVAIFLFNFVLYLWFRHNLLDKNLEIFVRESIPKFHWVDDLTTSLWNKEDEFLFFFAKFVSVHLIISFNDNLILF